MGSVTYIFISSFLAGLFFGLLLGLYIGLVREAQAQSVQMSASVGENICNSNLDILRECCK
jgi:formate/nitrite transporter FocA (FNT family)